MKKWYILIGAGLLGLGLFQVRSINLSGQQHFSSQPSSAGRDELPKEDVFREVPKPTETRFEILSDFQPHDLHGEIAQIETQLSLDGAIERLNSDVVDAEERTALAKKLQKLDHLRKQELEEELQALEKEIERLSDEHSARLEKFGIKKS